MTDATSQAEPRWLADPDAALAILDLMPDAATITRLADGSMLMANPAAAAMYGWPLAEMIGRTTLELGLFRNAAERQRMLGLLSQRDAFRNHESPFWNRSGQQREGMFSARVFRPGDEPCLLVIGRDITETKFQQRALRDSEARYRMLAEATLVVPWQIDLDGTLVYVGPGVKRWTYRAQDLVGGSVFELIHPEDAQALRQRLEQRRDRRRVPRLFRVRVRVGTDNYQVIEIDTAPVTDGTGRLVGVHGMARDIQEYIDTERRLLELARQDGLTGLLNRQGFVDEVDVALLFIDLDDFKRINDGAGHTSGDACLRQVADTLRGLLRGFDRAGRIGGDEFAVLLTPVDEIAAERVAQRILCAFQALRLSLPEEVAGVSASLGLCLAGPDDDVEDLLHKADQAMYRAKGAGKNRLEIVRAR